MHAGGDGEELDRLLARLAEIRKEEGDTRDDFEVHVISYDAYDLDGIKRLEDKGVTDCIVGFRIPYIKGPDTEPLEKKVEAPQRYAENDHREGGRVSETLDLTKPLQDAIAEAEELIANAPFIRTEQDRLEGYDYLSGRIRMAMQMAFDYDLDRPLFINPTHQFSRQGLDNPDAIYFNAYLREGVEYVVRGRRGTSADLSFQVMGGTYSADSAATSLHGLRRPRARHRRRRHLRVHLRRRAGRQDDDRARGLQRLGHRGARHAHDRAPRHDRPAGQAADSRRRWPRSTRSPRAASTGSIQTWFEFPKFFQCKEPVNTLTAPQSTPGGLASQRSSIGHYELADDEALIITVPRCDDCTYQAHPDRLRLVRLDRLRDPPDLAHQGPGRHRPRRR